MKKESKKISKKEYKREPSDLKFKGYPLDEFIDPHAFSIDKLAASPHILNAVMNHVKAITRTPQAGGTEFSGASKFTGAAPTNTTKATGTVTDLEIGAGLNNLSDGKVVADHGKPTKSFEGSLRDFLKGIYLANFNASALNVHPTRGAQLYVYDIGFNTDEKVGFVVDNPFDTLLTFEPAKTTQADLAVDLAQSRVPRMASYNVETEEKITGKRDGPKTRVRETHIAKVYKPKGPPKPNKICDLNLRIIVDNSNQLQTFSLHGHSIHIGLSKSLVQPVYQLSHGKYTKTGGRFFFALGDRVITFRKNSLPTWGGSIDLDGAVVSIRGNDLIGRLRSVNLGGTVEKPLIVFDDVELIKQT